MSYRNTEQATTRDIDAPDERGTSACIEVPLDFLRKVTDGIVKEARHSGSFERRCYLLGANTALMELVNELEYSDPAMFVGALDFERR